MCKECPEPKNNCPKCAPCGVEQCRDVIQCASNEQVSCPKCPAPTCPEPPEKVCPSFELPKSDIQRFWRLKNRVHFLVLAGSDDKEDVHSRIKKCHLRY